MTDYINQGDNTIYSNSVQVNENFSPERLLQNAIKDTHDLQSKLNELEKQLSELSKKSTVINDYYKSARRINTVVIYILVLLPVLLLALWTLLFFIIKPGSIMNILLCGAISLVGLVSLFDVVYVPRKIAEIEKKLDKLDL